MYILYTFTRKIVYITREESRRSLPVGNIATPLARCRPSRLAAAPPRAVVYHYFSIAHPSYVHAFPARMRGDQQRCDLGLVVLAQNGGRGAVEFGAFLGRETDLVPAAVTLLQLFQEMDPLLLQVSYVRRGQKGRGRGRGVDAGHDALDGVPSGRRWAIVVVQLPIAQHAALVIVVACPAPLAELVVAPEPSWRGLAVVAVVVRVLVGAPAAARHCRRMGRARARRASAT